MIDATFLEQGFATDAGDALYAEFYPDGQLKLFRSGPPGEPGKTITLLLDARKPHGRVEQTDISFEPSDEETDTDDFEEWARHWIRVIYERTQHVLRCSFCEKSNAEVATLIAGPVAYICDECIGACGQILQHNQTSTDPAQ